MKPETMRKLTDPAFVEELKATMEATRRRSEEQIRAARLSPTDLNIMVGQDVCSSCHFL